MKNAIKVIQPNVPTKAIYRPVDFTGMQADYWGNRSVRSDQPIEDIFNIPSADFYNIADGHVNGNSNDTLIRDRFAIGSGAFSVPDIRQRDQIRMRAIIYNPVAGSRMRDNSSTNGRTLQIWRAPLCNDSIQKVFIQNTPTGIGSPVRFPTPLDTLPDVGWYIYSFNMSDRDVGSGLVIQFDNGGDGNWTPYEGPIFHQWPEYQLVNVPEDYVLTQHEFEDPAMLPPCAARNL